LKAPENFVGAPVSASLDSVMAAFAAADRELFTRK
jgi:hypothetical protein